MRIVFISDTHNKHYQLDVPEGDMIIHAGDVSGRGAVFEVEDFLDWFSELPHKYKIFIAGNHDFYFERNSRDRVNELLSKYPGVTYLENEEIIIDGIKIYGSPVTPEFNDWAFNVKRGAAIREVWSLIPEDTNILVTHGPPYGFLDKLHPKFVKPGEDNHVGCKDLRSIVGHISPKIVCYGHIHEAYGMFKYLESTIINASVLNENYQCVNAPIVVDYE